jgi:ketosteroid isomerase-like protein
MQLDRLTARAFADDWIAAWNAHDLERILAHYAHEIVFLSPVALERMGDGRVVGIAALRSYWSKGLENQPDLKFDLVDTLFGHASLTIVYRNHRQQSAAETFEFDAGGKVVRSFACYGEIERGEASEATMG